MVRSSFKSQAREISSAAGLGFNYFYRMISFIGGGEYGIALLSQYAVEDIAFFDLTIEADREARGAIIARMELEGFDLLLAGTHLSVRENFAKEQLKRLITALGTVGRPWLLMGDLNLVDVGGIDKRFLESDTGSTWPSENPTAKLDRVLFSGIPAECIASQVECDPSLSDHCAILVDLCSSGNPRMI
jgi:endonuclease/exonuclease/phosphatase family metal-dependent hydrolase